MTNDPPACRLCGATQFEDLGALADGDLFAGRVLHTPLPGGRLWRCRSCESLLRSPVESAATYLDLYSRGAGAHWHGGAPREDLRVVRELIVANPGVRRVLDIGCGTGDFLVSLGAGYHAYGIEPSAAAAMAARRGVTIVGASIASLPADAHYDAIVLIDVIEHVGDVGALLDRAYAHVVPNGLLVVSTGDPCCAAWRRRGSRFWYSSFPEHLTFPSVAYFAGWAERHHAGPVSQTPIRYRSIGVWRRLLGLAIQTAYQLSPAAFDAVGRIGGWLMRRRAPRQRHYSPGIPGVFRDHQVLVVRRPVQRAPTTPG